MATYPGMVKNRGVRSTTVVSAQTTNALGKVVRSGQLTSSALQTSSRSRITAEDAKDPVRLVKIIGDIQAAQDTSTQATRSNPFSAPYIKRGVTFAPGQQVTVPHTLGRPFTDWHVARTAGAIPALLEVPPGSSHYPPQVTADKAVVLQDTRSAGATATVTIVVVGD